MVNKFDVVDIGEKWFNEHRTHVVLLMNAKDQGASYPPSGSDAINPSLWKSAHWRWFATYHPVENGPFKEDSE
jgi:hypothetical protein